MVTQQGKAAHIGLRRWSQTRRRLTLAAVSAAATFALVRPMITSADAASVQGVMKTAKAADKDGADFQKQVDGLHTDQESLLGEYEAVLQQTEALTAYNAQLAKLVASQEAELASVEDQIGRVTVVSRALTPLMLNLIDALGKFVELDVPFLMEERTKRVEKLQGLMDQADVSESEKYRQIIEAYTIETDYGRTIEHYQATVPLDGAEPTVDFLRIGRVALVFQSLDGEVVGHFNLIKVIQQFCHSNRKEFQYMLSPNEGFTYSI